MASLYEIAKMAEESVGRITALEARVEEIASRAAALVETATFVLGKRLDELEASLKLITRYGSAGTEETPIQVPPVPRSLIDLGLVPPASKPTLDDAAADEEADE